MLNLNPPRERLDGPFSPLVVHLPERRMFEVQERNFTAVGKGVVPIVDVEGCTCTIGALHVVSVSNRPRTRAKTAR